MIDGKTALMSILRTMKPGAGHWNTDHIDMYDIGLRNLPDTACDSVAVAILAKFDERPSAKQIMDIYAELSETDQPDGYTEVLGSLRSLVARYGENGAPHPQFPESWPRITAVGPPPELSTMSAAVQKTVQAFGGWVDFSRNFDWGNPADRAQFRDMYKVVTISASGAAIERIKLEYRENTRKRLEALPTETTPDNSVNTDAGLSRFDATSFMTKLSGKVNAL